jgi:3-oxoadipate enol-lactonase
MEFININGHTIHYRWISEGRKRTFVFINSLGTDFRIWSDVADQLKADGNILLADKRGHGLSDVVPDTSGLKSYADDVQALMDALNIENAIVVGLSVGGMIAQMLAGRIPGKIEKLVLCDTRHKIGNDQVWNDRIAAVQRSGLAAISEGVMGRWFSEKFRNEHATRVKGYRNMLERTPTTGYIKACEAIRDADLTDIAKEIAIPTLCVVGSEDKSTTVEEVKSLAKLIKGSKFEVIDGSGHIPCVDNPQILVELIRDFVYKL